FTAPGQSPRTIMEPQPIVFVIDDDVSVREALAPLISSAGWSVETFGSGQDFLRRAKVDAPACLVLDVELPDLNGLDLQKHLTEDKRDHFHHRPWRHPDDGAGHEGRRRGVLDQAVSRRSVAR